MIIEQSTKWDKAMPFIFLTILVVFLVSVFAFPHTVFGGRRYIETPTTKSLVDINNDTHISKFEDDGNICYVAAYSTTDQPTISCVRKNFNE